MCFERQTLTSFTEKKYREYDFGVFIIIMELAVILIFCVLVIQVNKILNVFTQILIFFFINYSSNLTTINLINFRHKIVNYSFLPCCFCFLQFD